MNTNPVLNNLHQFLHLGGAVAKVAYAYLPDIRCTRAIFVRICGIVEVGGGEPTDAGAAEQSWKMAEAAAHRAGCTAEDSSPPKG